MGSMKKTLTTLIMLRNKRNITQSILAKEMNISRVELSVIERGKRKLNYERIKKYIKAMNNIEINL